MAIPFQILSAATITGTSTAFRVNGYQNAQARDENSYLQIYGTLGTATFDLQYKAADGNYYSTGDTIIGLGLKKLSFSNDLVLRLSYTAGGSSSISAAVVGGAAE